MAPMLGQEVSAVAANPSASEHFQEQDDGQPGAAAWRTRYGEALIAGSCVVVGWLRLLLVSSQVANEVQNYDILAGSVWLR